MLKQIQLLFILLLSSICAAQVHGEKEFQECEVVFKDSTSFVGFCKIKKNNQILFTMDRDSTPDTWDATMVKSVRLYRSYQDQVLEYWKINKKRKPKLLEILIYGDVMLYVRTTKRRVKDPKKTIVEGTDYHKDYKYKDAVIGYYLKRKNTDELVPIKLSWSDKNWKRKMIAYFKDCPLLVEDIKDDAYDKKSIRQLVEDYNVYCTE
ncbi:hypothetical protein [Kordia sp.]|uniref:hypothetical protein n=1 Tax=Kordia sp. TaxID=1965332 RepID=UPI003B5C1693